MDDLDDLRKRGAKWMEKIRAAEGREDVWLRDAKIAEDIYLASDKAERKYDFNILHSNVETIVPAIINSAPIPDIRERFRKGSEDEPARVAAQMIERCIQVCCDDGRLEEEIEGVAQDAFTVGRGILRVRMTQRWGVEALGFEVHPWNDFRFGPARRWDDVPWEAFRFHVPKEAVDKMTDEKVKELLAKGSSDEIDPGEDTDAELWEVWDKDSRAVLFIANDVIIKETPDPLGLSGFFPNPMPAMPIRSTASLTPVVPFRIYERLADELDEVTRRITKLTKACKAVGLVAGESADSLSQLEEAEDSTLIPVPMGQIEGVATAGMNGAIAWWPIEKIIMALRELFVARDQCKAAIYEITGISDIIRGASQAAETATAQEIKTQWGSLRVKKLQKLIERLVRDTFVICAEIICSKFQPATIQRMSGVPMTPEVAQFFGNPLDHFRIDVESDSTVRADLTRMRQDMAEWLRGTSEYMNAMIMPMAASPMTMPMIPAAMKLYATFARTFSLGKQGEDAIEEIIAATQQAVEQQQAQPPQPSPEEIKAQGEQAKAQAAMQKAQSDAAIKQTDQALKQQELELAAQEGGLKAQETAAKIELTQAQTQKVYAEIGKTQVETEIADTQADIDASLAMRGEQRTAEGDMHARSMREREFERAGETQRAADERASAESAAKVKAMQRKPNGNG